MKNVVLNKKFDVEKNRRTKVFTKKEKNIIIRKKNNPLNKNRRRVYEREGLFMNGTKDVILNEIMKELNFIERVFFKKKIIKMYNKVRVDIVNAMLK